MTIVMLLMLGTGVIMVASALDNTPIIKTFQKITSGQALDITGGSSNANTAQQTSNPTTPVQPPTVNL